MKFFTLETKTTELLGATFTYKQPKAINGNINIKDDFAWKNIVSRGSTGEVPSITLTEYELPYGKWMQNIASVFTASQNAIGSGGQNLDPYASLYTGNPTGFQYTLPYLVKPGGSLKGSIRNNWEEIDLVKSVSDLGIPGIDKFKSAENLLSNLYGNYGYEKLRGFKKTQPRTITVSFPLYNTVSLKNTSDNFWFIHLFMLQNLKVRTTYITYIPPKIYNITPNEKGGVYMSAAYVSDYTVSSIGSTRAINIGEGGNQLIPEAYKVDIQFTEMVDPSANLEAGSIDPSSRVQVINPSGGGNAGDIQGTLESAFEGGFRALQTGLNSASTIIQTPSQ